MLLGWDEDGTPIVLSLAYSAHALVAGLTRSGKSITVNTLLAYASLMRDVRLIVIDPNLGAVAPWWRTAYKVSDAFHPDEPTEILRWVREEMQRRERLFWSGRTDRITEFSPELPLLLVVIDEVANYTRHPDRKARERFEAELLAIASQGAKFGIRLWLLSQKPSADVLTTAVRTNLSARICHRVDTVEDFLHLFPDGRDLDITAADRTMPQGVSIASVGDMRTPVRLRSVYLSTEACWQILFEVAATRVGGELRLVAVLGVVVRLRLVPVGGGIAVDVGHEVEVPAPCLGHGTAGEAGSGGIAMRISFALCRDSPEGARGHCPERQLPGQEPATDSSHPAGPSYGNQLGVTVREFATVAVRAGFGRTSGAQDLSCTAFVIRRQGPGTAYELFPYPQETAGRHRHLATEPHHQPTVGSSLPVAATGRPAPWSRRRICRWPWPVGGGVVVDVVHRRQADRRPMAVERLVVQRVHLLGVRMPWSGATGPAVRPFVRV
ncbi:FtsK/SpoIIIE domain-containing protein [Streptomyces sp. NPDC006510]|uniref:FtsK/SpoIIIE domain-containing protein n=1 Tax=Streptomyces sp. NPDC006510 TaxID=3155600 RepID=UPI00339DFA96